MFPDTYEEIKKYGEDRKNSGKNYSAKLHIAKSLSKFSENSNLSFIEYLKAPKNHESPVIALWDYNSDNIETIKIGRSIKQDISEIIYEKN